MRYYQRLALSAYIVYVDNLLSAYNVYPDNFLSAHTLYADNKYSFNFLSPYSAEILYPKSISYITQPLQSLTANNFGPKEINYQLQFLDSDSPLPTQFKLFLQNLDLL